MSTLSQDLELLRKLNEYRDKTKELREQSLHALKAIKEIKSKKDRQNGSKKIYWKEEITVNQEKILIDFNKWITSQDKVEAALVLKVQNHRDISENEKENNKSRKSTKLEEVLKKIDFNEELLQSAKTKSTDKSPTIPVLVAARVMQALSSRAATVFEPATMKCYYRIIRELYGVAQPNWTVGAARAGVGGTTSAFVTNECIRAIFSFENALERTYKFFEQTHIFCENFSYLEGMLDKLGITNRDKDHPLYIWADKITEMMWLDCYLATNPRTREMALFQNDGNDENALLLPDEDNIANVESAKKYFMSLTTNLKKAIDQLFLNVAEVYYEIYEHRLDEETNLNLTPPIDLNLAKNKRLKQSNRYKFIEQELSGKEKAEKDDRENKFNRTATAHLFALKVIDDAVKTAHNLQSIFSQDEFNPIVNGVNKCNTKEILKELSKEFYKIKRRVHRVLQPSKQYLKWVLNRELAASEATFDAGELVFAATSYGAINNWRLDDKLNRACEKLINSLPDNGRLPSNRPFQANERGYRSVPIGCEMSRALANLLQKTGYDFDAQFVGKIIGVFDDNLIELTESTAEAKLIAWNFEGAPHPDKPAVWVTAISVIALDRIVRMLNARINEIVLKHFDVTKPEHPHTKLTLHDLIYGDYGLVKWCFKDDLKLTALNLQKMRAHIMRATLPINYQTDEKNFSDQRNFSAIFYGPPGTGKTTLAESLALSSRVPLIKLSPSDLILQGQELIEGRARDVFEALSMLTQCVVIFDEFEPVLKNRKKNEILISNLKKGDPSYDMAQMSAALQKISQRDDPKFRFVLGGMLPKFGKLHDAAEKQSFVYCLGTNYLNDIDYAAKRKGRFDKKFPVYKPDALSRAGILFYRLSQTEEFDQISDESDFNQVCRRIIKVIAETIGEPADQISKFFEVKKGDNAQKIAAGVLPYILGLTDELPEDLTKKDLKDKVENLKEEITRAAADEDEKEEAQREWLIKYESDFVDAAEHIDTEINDQMERKEIVKLLNKYLMYKKP